MRQVFWWETGVAIMPMARRPSSGRAPSESWKSTWGRGTNPCATASAGSSALSSLPVSEKLEKIVAIDTLLGKRSLIIKIKTRVVTNISIAIFRFNHESFSSKKKLRDKNCNFCIMFMFVTTLVLILITTWKNCLLSLPYNHFGWFFGKLLEMRKYS